MPQLYSPLASYIASQLYLDYVQVIFASRILEANIISLVTFILEIGIILKYVTHYDTFKLKVSFFNIKENWEKLLYEVSPKEASFLSYQLQYILFVSLGEDGRQMF